jgi:hypothetical protein
MVEAAGAAEAAWVATRAAWVEAARVAGAAARAAEATERATWEAAREAGAAAMEATEWAHRVAAEADEWATTWANFDPCGLLERLIKIDSTQGAA